MKRCIIREIALMMVLLLTASGLALAEDIEMSGPEEYVGEQEVFLGDQTDEKAPDKKDEEKPGLTDEKQPSLTDEEKASLTDVGGPSLTDEEKAGEEKPVHTDEEKAGEEKSGEEKASEDQPGEEKPGEEQLDQTDEEKASEDQSGEDQPGEEQPAQTDEVGKVDEEQPSLVLNGILDGLVYNGEAQPLVIAEEGILYSLDGENFSAEVPTGIDAGEYTVYIKPVGGGEVMTVTVTIEKADVVFTPPIANV